MFEHWEEVMQDFFTPTTLWKLTLWKDNERREAKPFGKFSYFFL
jgi:hypothetical protein